MRILYQVVFLLCFAVCALAQGGQTVFRGRVLDSASGAPLPFVNILVEGTKIGLQTDLEGDYSFSVAQPSARARFSYVGYRTLTVNLRPGNNAPIQLGRLENRTETVELVMGENPAHRIIRSAVANRKQNNPETGLESFRYLSHSKMYVTLDAEKTKEQLEKARRRAHPDTLATLSEEVRKKRISRLRGAEEGDSILRTQHVFMTETVSERKFRQPNLSNETVLGTKVSGFPTLSFATLATQFQPFTLYGDYIKFLNLEFLNPISPNSEKRYLFVLEDTVLNSRGDTTFLISFKPRRTSNIQGMKGVVYINTNKFAIQNIVAENADSTNIAFSIQQKYNYVGDKQWFPEMIKTRLTLNNMQINNVPMVVQHKGSIDSVVLNPTLKRSKFIEEELEVPVRAVNLDSLKWKGLRLDSLTLQERNTYNFYDTTVAKVQKAQRIATAVEWLGTGKLPWRKVGLDIDLNRLIRFNRYEAVRLGFGAHTSAAWSTAVSLGGYVGYGVKDDAFKYGGDFSWLIYRRREVSLKLEAYKDILEPGQPSMPGRRNLLSNELFRNFLAQRFDRAEVYRAGIAWRPIKFLQAEATVQHRFLKPNYRYDYLRVSDGGTSYSFALAEAVFSLRYAVGETFTRWQGVKIHTGNSYPVFRVVFTQGLDQAGIGNFAYNKYEFRAEQDFTIRNVGKSKLRLQTGLAEGDLPYQVLFNSAGAGVRRWPVLVDNHFQTMGLYEFASNRFANLLWTHDFGTLLFKGKHFEPMPGLSFNAGIGELDNAARHNLPDQGGPLRGYDKGYYEGGVFVNNLLILKGAFYNTGLGVAAFYRMGPYTLPDANKNLFVKLISTISL